MIFMKNDKDDAFRRVPTDIYITVRLHVFRTFSWRKPDYGIKN